MKAYITIMHGLVEHKLELPKVDQDQVIGMCRMLAKIHETRPANLNFPTIVIKVKR